MPYKYSGSLLFYCASALAEFQSIGSLSIEYQLDQVNLAEPLGHRQATIQSVLRVSMNRGSQYKRYKHNRNGCADKSEPPASTSASTLLQATTHSKPEQCKITIDITSCCTPSGDWHKTIRD